MYVDLDDNNYDSNDNYQHCYDFTSDSGNEHNVDESDDDNDRDPNDIGQNEEAATISRRNHNMNTRGNRRGNMVHGLPSANNGSGLNGSHWSASHIYPMLSAMVVAEQAGVRMMKKYFEIEAFKINATIYIQKGIETFW